jgi:tRNA nucleotidyltransferase/poly(A) polymerase
MICFNSNIIPRTKGAYLVGGAVRDILAQRLPEDFDFTVKDNPRQFAMAIGEKTGCPVITLGKPGLVLYRILSPYGMFDVSPMVGSSIEDDLASRDFSINAMAVDTESGEVIDPHHGQKDMTEKQIRMISEHSFIHDPIRLIRAYRFNALFSFDIDDETGKAIRKHQNLITHSPGERIQTELKKILATKNAYSTFSMMRQSGLVFNIFPELQTLQGCGQNRHHDFDVLDHTFLVLKHLEDLLNQSPGWLPYIHDDHGSETMARRRVILKYAALFHDIGKPVSKTEQNGNIHFYGHEMKSMDLFMTIAERLKFSNDEKKEVLALIKHHLRPLFLYSDYRANRLSRKSKTSFFLACGAQTPDVLLHGYADFLSKRQDGNTAETPFFENFFQEMAEEYFSIHLPAVTRKKLITGSDLIREFHLSPSPLFRAILDHVEESRLSGGISTKTEAMDKVKMYLETKAGHSSS